MQLEFEEVIPIPIRQKIVNRTSGIWNRSVAFTGKEKIFIQAPSGTGKTTLVHLLYGLRSDFEGKILWDKNSVATITSEGFAQLRTHKISVVFQDLRLFQELTAFENIEIKRKLADTVAENTCLEWMDRLGLKDKVNATARTLSYGEQQRVAIIRALSQPFDWLLMDEPFSHLDHNNINKVVGLINEAVTTNNAGLILADLEDNDYFQYDQKIFL